MIPEEILMDFMYEWNDFRSKKANYDISRCSLIFRYEMYLVVKERMNIECSDDKLAKALLNEDAALRIGNFEGVKVIVAFNDLGGNDFMVIRADKATGEGLTSGEMIPQYVTEML